jgi:hypothetical protein
MSFIMSDEPISVRSELWTGELPTSPRPRREPTKGQLVLTLLISVYGVWHAPWVIFDGFRRGLIQIPLKGYGTPVSIRHPSAFAACVVVWSIAFLLMALLGWFCAGLLLKKLRH